MMAETQEQVLPSDGHRAHGVLGLEQRREERPHPAGHGENLPEVDSELSLNKQLRVGKGGRMFWKNPHERREPRTVRWGPRGRRRALVDGS